MTHGPALLDPPGLLGRSWGAAGGPAASRQATALPSCPGSHLGGPQPRHGAGRGRPHWAWGLAALHRQCTWLSRTGLFRRHRSSALLCVPGRESSHSAQPHPAVNLQGVVQPRATAPCVLPAHRTPQCPLPTSGPRLKHASHFFWEGNAASGPSGPLGERTCPWHPHHHRPGTDSPSESLGSLLGWCDPFPCTPRAAGAQAGSQWTWSRHLLRLQSQASHCNDDCSFIFREMTPIASFIG